MHGANWESPRSPNGANHAVPEKLLGETALFLFCLPYLQGKHSVKAQGIAGADQAAFATSARPFQFHGSNSATRLAG